MPCVISFILTYFNEDILSGNKIIINKINNKIIQAIYNI